MKNRFVKYISESESESESEVTQSCLTPCDPMDCSLPGSSVHGIYQARILEWVAIGTTIQNIRRTLKTQNKKINNPILKIGKDLN